MFNIKKPNNEKAFTFIELLAAIIVLTIGVLSVIAISSKSYSAISLQKNKLIATNLAKEGIELVLNVRGENWLYKDNSDCDRDSQNHECLEGQVFESEHPEYKGDCDWRCGDESEISPRPKFVLKLGSGGLTDLDYTMHAHPGDTCCYLLYSSPEGFYRHQQTGDTETPFIRVIQVYRHTDLNGDGIATNDIQVVVGVMWQERGRWETVMLEEHLYNWYK